MAINKPSEYGLDIACRADADAFWSTTTGTALVYQDAYHRITTDNVVGPGGVGWGYDCRRLLGMPTAQLEAQQGVIAEVLRRDPRIQSAEVLLTSSTRAGGMADVRLSATCYTADGPFSLIIGSIADLTAGTIEGQA